MSQATTTSCPICKKPGTEKYRPFCSKRCADIDLGHWFSGSYAVAAEEQDDSEYSELDSEGQHPWIEDE